MKKKYRLLSVFLSAAVSLSGTAVFAESGQEEAAVHEEEAANESMPAEQAPCIPVKAENDKPEKTDGQNVQERTQLQSTDTKGSWEAGSLGFFQSVDATKAVEILRSDTSGYTRIGASDDATDLKNMLRSLDIIEDANTIRASRGLPVFKVSDSMMAVCQVRANWSCRQYVEENNYDHAPWEVCTLPDANSFSENLDNYGNPTMEVSGAASLRVPRNSFDPWYYYEKQIYENNPNAPYSEVGHYLNLIDDEKSGSGAAYVPSRSDGVSGTCLQMFFGTIRSETTYSVNAYRTRLQTYLDTLPKPSIATAQISSIPDTLYTGQAQRPDFTVTFDGKQLNEGSDYTVSYSNNTNAGQATVTVSGTGDYSGSCSAAFTILPVPVEECTAAKQGRFELFEDTSDSSLLLGWNDQSLANGRDYSILLWTGDHDNASAYVQGRGNFTGEAEFTLPYDAVEMRNCEIVFDQSELVYNEGSQGPDQVCVIYRNYQLDTARDYSLSGQTGIDAGTYTLIASGTGRFSGTVSAEYTIAPKPFNARFAFSADPGYYVDEPVFPQVTVQSDTGTMLQAGTDFELVYTDNDSIGTGRVTVSGKGNYTGSATVDFPILDGTVYEEFDLNDPDISITYDQSRADPSNPAAGVCLFRGSVPLSENVQYVIETWPNSDRFGLDNPVFIIRGKDNVSGTRSIPYRTLVPYSLHEMSEDALKAVVWRNESGELELAACRILWNDRAMTENEDYTLELVDTGNPHSCQISIQGIGLFADSASFTVPVGPVSLDDCSVYLFGGDSHSVKPEDFIILYNGLSFDPDEGILVDANLEDTAYGKQWNIILTGRNYLEGTRQMTKTAYDELEKAVLSESVPVMTYTGRPIEPAVHLLFADQSGIFQRERYPGDYQAAYRDNVNAGQGQIVITPSPSVLSSDTLRGTKVVSFVIEPADLAQTDIRKPDPAKYKDLESYLNAISIRYNAMTLVRNRDYTLNTKTDPENKGHMQVTVSGKGNYTGSRSWSVTDFKTSNSEPVVKPSDKPGNKPADSSQTPSEKPGQTGTDPKDPVKKPAAEKQTMYRLYNPNSGEHFYTANSKEKDFLDQIGWNYEGIAWTAPKTSAIPVYRLYNPNAGDHHYTSDANERDVLVKVGWKFEGIGWYSDAQKEVALLRLYNPNAKQAGAHHYTIDANERDALVRLGWKDEGIGWYGMK